MSCARERACKNFAFTQSRRKYLLFFGNLFSKKSIDDDDYYFCVVFLDDEKTNFAVHTHTCGVCVCLKILSNATTGDEFTFVYTRELRERERERKRSDV